MKNLILLFIIIVLTTVTSSATEIDTIWYRTMSAGAQDVDFTPDDKYVIAWTNSIEFWEVQQGVEEFSVPIETVGDYNFNEQYLVIAHYSTPKLLNWQTREVVEGFEKENENIGRIRTAKSKNEFMAQSINRELWDYHKDRNIIYFWDINSKSKIDSIIPIEEFKIKDVSWRRRILDYDYLGSNDEFIYVKYDDLNNIVQTLPTTSRKTNYFYHFYSIETKELIDSIFVFQEKYDDVSFVDKITVLSDRTKIAWNNKGGEINFYDINTRQYYDKLVYDTHDFVEAFDIEFNHDESFVGITHGYNLKIFNMNNKEKIYEYFDGSWQNLSFSNNDELLTTNIGSYLILFPSHTGTSSVEGIDNINFNLTVNPNPTTNNINIRFGTPINDYMKLGIVDLLGNEIFIIDQGYILSSDYQTNFNVSTLPSGTYFIRLEIGNEVVVKQFIKE
jgi:type IX secretion system substrate protein